MSAWRRLPPHPLWILLAGLLMAASTLGAGLVMDDVLMRMRLTGAETAWGQAPWWDLYTFARPDLNAALRDVGFHPWWADPSVKMTFYRPLSSLTHALDYALWPDQPALHHLHSALWYAAAVAAAWATLRALSPERATLGAWIFAVAAPHVSTVGWVAARNTMIAFVLSCALLLLHVRWREGRAPALAPPLLLALGLLAGEAALGGIAYVIAWQLCVEEGPWRRRLLALAPCGAVALGWRLLYVHHGFGAQASGIYHDPGGDPGGFLAELAVNWPALTLSRWLLVPVDAWAVMPALAKQAVWGLALIAIPALLFALWPTLRRSAEARFWGLGSALALLPFTATMPMDRLLLFAGLGSSALLAAFIQAPGPRRSAQLAAAALALWHLPVSGALGLAKGLTLAGATSSFTNGLVQDPDDDALTEQTLVYVSGTFHRVHHTTLMRLTTGAGAAPRRSVVLTSMMTGAEITRVDLHTLEITPEGGFLLLDLDRIHRRDARSLQVGDRVALPDLDVEVLALTEDGRPARAAFRFHEALESPTLRWVSVDVEDLTSFPPEARTRDFPLPAVGEAVRTEGMVRPL